MHICVGTKDIAHDEICTESPCRLCEALMNVEIDIKTIDKLHARLSEKDWDIEELEEQLREAKEALDAKDEVIGNLQARLTLEEATTEMLKDEIENWKAYVQNSDTVEL